MTDPLLLLEHVSAALLDHQLFLGVFVDLQKACDTAWWFHSLDLRGDLPVFIRILLSDRSFRVQAGATLLTLFLNGKVSPSAKT